MRVSICPCNKKTSEKCAHANYILRTHTTPPHCLSCHLPFAICHFDMQTQEICVRDSPGRDSRYISVRYVFVCFPGCVVCSALYQYWSGRVETRYKLLTGCSLIFHPSPPTPSLHTLFLSFPTSKHPYSSNSRTIIITFLKPHSFPSRKGKIVFFTIVDGPTIPSYDTEHLSSFCLLDGIYHNEKKK